MKLRDHVRAPTHIQLVRYSLIGVLNVAIDVGLLTVGVRLTGIDRGLGLVALASVSFSCAIVNSYFWNARWTFQSRIDVRRHAISFVFVNLVALVITDAVIAALTTIRHPWIGSSPLLHVDEAKAVAIVVSGVWNFVGLRSFVFRESDASHARACPCHVVARDQTAEVSGGDGR